MRCPYCARPLKMFGMRCRVCRRYIFHWYHIALFVLFGVVVVYFVFEYLLQPQLWQAVR